ncbi:hypothetical protein CDAR_171771 [Caerostris darwini]|uniref:Uncharacterized protein n=1 Tax=Caerostris darwini TaxID=1538125 RepID=A0AAV4QPX8_9ARAC|nr:hypothetical protein CDAR_171771 [Caerostris darwini]
MSRSPGILPRAGWSRNKFSMAFQIGECIERSINSSVMVVMELLFTLHRSLLCSGLPVLYPIKCVYVAFAFEEECSIIPHHHPFISNFVFVVAPGKCFTNLSSGETGMPQRRQKDYERTRLHYEISSICEEEKKKNG